VISAVLFIALVIDVFSLTARIVVCPMIGFLNILGGFRSITLGTNAFLVTFLVGVASLVMVVELTSFASACAASQSMCREFSQFECLAGGASGRRAVTKEDCEAERELAGGGTPPAR